MPTRKTIVPAANRNPKNRNSSRILPERQFLPRPVVGLTKSLLAANNLFEWRQAVLSIIWGKPASGFPDYASIHILLYTASAVAKLGLPDPPNRRPNPDKDGL